MAVVQYTGAGTLQYDSILGRSWSVRETAVVDATTAAALVGTGVFTDVSASMGTPTSSAAKVLGPYIDVPTLQAAYPAAQNVGNVGLTGTAPPYTRNTSDGSTWSATSGGAVSSVAGKTGAVTLTSGDVGAIGIPASWAASASGGTPTLTSGTAILGTAYLNTTAGYTTFTTAIDGIPGVWQGDILECLTAGTYTLQPKDVQSTAQKSAGATAGVVAVDASKVLYYPDGTTISLGGAAPSTTNVLKGNGSGGIVAATPNVDYRLPPVIQAGVTLILPPSGSTVGASGAAFTAATAFDQTYANSFMKFNANEIASGQAAGWYYVEMSSTTAGIVYNNTYTPGSGLPTVPASKTAFTTNAGGTTAGTVASTVALSTTMAADSLGANGVIRYSAIARWNNSAGTKKALTYLGASLAPFVFVQGTTTNGSSGVAIVSNAGVKNKQWNYPETWAAVTTSIGALTVDTTSSQAVTINLQTSTATDWVALVLGRIEIFPQA